MATLAVVLYNKQTRTVLDSKIQASMECDSKIQASMELLASVDYLTVIPKALNEVKEKAAVMNSKECNSISSLLITLAKESEHLATMIKASTERAAPIIDLSYAHCRLSTHQICRHQCFCQVTKGACIHQKLCFVNVRRT